MVFFLIFSLFSQHTLHFVKSEIAKWGKNEKREAVCLPSVSPVSKGRGLASDLPRVHGLYCYSSVGSGFSS